MARRLYFAFHHDDVVAFRANVVRLSWVTKPDREAAGFYDASLWEKAKTQGTLGIKRLINGGLFNTSVTAVLTGSHTYSRPWVRYEIVKGLEQGNGLFGIYIHNIPDKFKLTVPQGPNPFEYLSFQHEKFGDKASIFEWNGRAWIPYKEIPKIPKSRIPSSLGMTEGQFSKLFPLYDWVQGSGYSNLGTWVEQAARRAGR